jgi:protein-S-isoprenylcysteine O-methyltransferase Ste14
LPTKIYFVFCLIISVSQLFFAPQYGEDAIILWAPTAAMAVVYIFVVNFGYAFFYRVYKEWKKQKTSGGNGSLVKTIAFNMINTPLGNLAIGLMVVFATGLFDLVDSMFLNMGILSSLYGFTVFTLGASFILVKKSGDLYNELEETNAGLEITVKERTRDLEEQTQIALSASRAKTDFLAKPLKAEETAERIKRALSQGSAG